MRYFLWVLCLVLAGSVQAATRHGVASFDPIQEIQAHFGDAMHGYATANCLHATSGTTSAAITNCSAYGHDTNTRKLLYLEETVSRTITYSGGDGQYFLIAHASLSETVTGWTRVTGTHYLWKLSATRPALPAGALFLARVTVAGGAITAVRDMRNSRPYNDHIDVTAPLYGAKGDGVTDDAPAFAAACTAARNRWFAYQIGTDSANGQAQVIYFPPGRTYVFATSATCLLTTELNDNLQIVIQAHGATLRWTNTTPDAVMINFSPNTSCTATDGTWGVPFVRKVFWHGGVIQGPTHGERIGIMIKAYGIRGFSISDTAAMNFQVMLDVCVQNTFLVERNIWTTFEYAVRQSDTGVNEVSGAQGGQSSTHTRIVGNTFSAGTTTTTGCHTVLGLLSGAWQALSITENSIQGRCSNAWIDVVSGESDTRDNQAINISYNTLEQAASTEEDPSYGFRVRRRAGSAKSVIGVTMIGNELRFGSTINFRGIELYGVFGATILSNFLEAVNAETWIGIQINDSQNVFAHSNHFERGAPDDGTCFRLLGTLNNHVNLGHFSCGGIRAIDDDAYGPKERYRYRVGDGIRFFSSGVNKRFTHLLGTNDFNGGTAMATASGNATVDMSHASNLGSDFLGGYTGLAPRGYMLRVQILDTNSEPGSSPSAFPSPSVWIAATPTITLADLSVITTPLADRLICSAAGMVDNAWVPCEGYVNADVNGDIYVEWLASGTNALKIAIIVLAIYD